MSILGTAMAVTASAADAGKTTNPSSLNIIGVEFTHDKNYVIKPASEELLAASSLDEIAEISLKNFEESAFSSDDVVSKVSADFEDYLMEQELLEMTATSSYTISQEPFFAYICYADGISATELVTAKNDSDAALSEAQTVYPNDPGNLQDSYRHFTWNFRLTKDISKAKARIITCDYEWEAVLRPYAQSAYDEYIASGYSSSTALTKAYQYAYYMRDDCYSVCAAGVNYFSAIFNNASVRDFWNNCYGRAYAANYTSRSAAFSAANNAGVLINSDSSVTSTHINNVWSWDWYTV
jgi:hypothetical protein